MSTNTSVFLLITLWASMQGSLGLPVVKELEVEVEVADSVRPPRVRTKRCACSSPQDSECHYFCHLDIIWVNTPSKTTVYGLGNSLSRRRRSTSRCTCGNPSDKTCTNFCYRRPELNPSNRSLKKRQQDILSILRAAASRALDASTSDRAQRKKAR